MQGSSFRDPTPCRPGRFCTVSRSCPELRHHLNCILNSATCRVRKRDDGTERHKSVRRQKDAGNLYVCMHADMFACVHRCMHVYTYIYISRCVYTCKCVCFCTHGCMFVCLPARVYLCMQESKNTWIMNHGVCCVCVYIYVYIHIIYVSPYVCGH